MSVLCRSKLNGRIYFAGRFFRVFDGGQNNCYFDSAVKNTNTPQFFFLWHLSVLTGTITTPEDHLWWTCFYENKSFVAPYKMYVKYSFPPDICEWFPCFGIRRKIVCKCLINVRIYPSPFAFMRKTYEGICLSTYTFLDLANWEPLSTV